MNTDNKTYQIIFYAISTASFLCMLDVFIKLQENERVCIVEPNQTIRLIEIIMLLFGIGYALAKTIKIILNTLHKTGEDSK